MVDRERVDAQAKIRELETRVREMKASEVRAAENQKDVTQLMQELQDVRAKLQTREKELVSERQRNEELCRQQALSQQTLMTRIAALESPSIGTASSVSTNQSREARQVKLPSWMRLKR